MPPEPISATATATVAMTVASGLGAAIGVSFIDTASMSFLGVPAIVPFFAFMGSMAALVYSEAIRPWYRLTLILWANTVLGIVGAIALPLTPLFLWTDAIPKQALAFVIAGLALWIMPVLANRAAPAFAGFMDRLFSARAKE